MPPWKLRVVLALCALAGTRCGGEAPPGTAGASSSAGGAGGATGSTVSHAASSGTSSSSAGGASAEASGTSSSSSAGGGASGGCQTNEDCPGKRGACGGPACYGGQCGLDNRPMHAPCDEDGGKVCDGAGTCVPCLTGAECASGICTAQTCASPTCTDGVKNGEEADVDCGLACPKKCAPGAACAADGDCRGGACDTALHTCAPTCTDGALSLPIGETDVDCGGPACAPCPLGAACLTGADCASERCEGGACVPIPTCSDGAPNGSETDVDCGGASCPPCTDGQTCAGGADCTSGVCAEVCAPPSCSDGVKNGGEIAVDCGATCGSCPDGSACGTNADCASKVCSGPPGALTCAVPTCSDSVKNGTETDFDCGGACPTKCPTFYDCLVDADCIGGLCAQASHTCAPTCTDGYQDGGETDIDCGGPCPKKCPVLQHCNVNADCVNNHCVTGHCTP